MKNLIYKELKLSIHPACYLFATVLTILFSLTPGFGPSIALFYCVISFPFMLIGASKGKSTNDIYYSVLLPIRKRDIVKGKMFSFVFLELITLASTLIGCLINFYLLNKGKAAETVSGLGFETFGTLVGLGLIGYGVVNIIFFIMYFKNAASITLPTIISCIFMVLFMGGLGIALPTILSRTQLATWDKFTSFTAQGIEAGIGAIIFIGLNFVAYFIAAKEFDKSDR